MFQSPGHCRDVTQDHTSIHKGDKFLCHPSVWDARPWACFSRDRWSPFLILFYGTSHEENTLRRVLVSVFPICHAMNSECLDFLETPLFSLMIRVNLSGLCRVLLRTKGDLTVTGWRPSSWTLSLFSYVTHSLGHYVVRFSQLLDVVSLLFVYCMCLYVWVSVTQSVCGWVWVSIYDEQ